MSGTLGGGARMLLEPDAARLLAEFGIPYVEHGVAETEETAVKIAARIGYPVVLKVVSADIVHKTEAGGVVTGLKDEWAVRDGLRDMLKTVRGRHPHACIDGALVARQIRSGPELIIGAVHDAIFGPTVMIGMGGVFAEALDDVVFRLPPLRRADGLDMLHELRGSRILNGFRGQPPADLDGVADVVARVGDLFRAHPEITEIDLNPVVATAQGCVALDARVIVNG